jgi:hypothetical protein
LRKLLDTLRDVRINGDDEPLLHADIVDEFVDAKAAHFDKLQEVPGRSLSLLWSEATGVKAVPKQRRAAFQRL